ncbi:hypothetical protein [Telmatospirillum siberiense]|uniref:Uncharacterized protein n=1 Tax=Telmatospirillum siberiense TaxID=382514 RepID=A0A2N3Q001_9PROT|nr:hypothetical protein [Telmatospirillum siberiense]PKU25983.1 hypothetical protein CWS72_02235 [Telmatospirillum siberiense]
MPDAIIDLAIFDEHGRCVPSSDLKAEVHRRTRRRFVCIQPEIDYSAIHSRIAGALNDDGGLSRDDFERQARSVLDKVSRDPATSGLAKGIHLPFFLPRMPDALSRDIGSDLDKIYLPAVEKSFLDAHPQSSYTRHHKGSLTGQLSVTGGSRHDRLLQAVSRTTVVGYFFLALQEYSVPASVEQVRRLPDTFLLAGGADTCAAFAGSPSLLLNPDAYPPLLWLAALSAEKLQTAYHLEAYGRNLTFNRRVHFDQAAEYWAAGLTVLAE